MSVADIALLYAECVKLALPFAFVFWAGEMFVTTVLRTAFGGRLSFNIH